MPEPQSHPQADSISRVARNVLIAIVALAALKFALFAWTNSLAVLSDALESIINIVAALLLVYTIRLSNHPPDENHPYGHGKIEFMAVGIEGCMILFAGLYILYAAIERWVGGAEGGIHIDRVTVGLWGSGALAIVTIGIALYVRLAARRYHNQVLLADSQHLFTDAASTVGVLLGLLLVRMTQKPWIDPAVAIGLAAMILFTSWRLLWRSVGGLMDRVDPADVRTIHSILDDEVTAGSILGYHKVRYRHTGPFHWVDLHLQVRGDMNVRESHTLASRIEHRIEQALGQANATAHVEPPEAMHDQQVKAPDPTPPDQPDATAPPHEHNANADDHDQPRT